VRGRGTRRRWRRRGLRRAPRLRWTAAAGARGKKAKRYCWCRKGENEAGGGMVECGGCRDWYHFACIDDKRGKGALVTAQRAAKQGSLLYCERAYKAQKANSSE